MFAARKLPQSSDRNAAGFERPRTRTHRIDIAAAIVCGESTVEEVAASFAVETEQVEAWVRSYWATATGARPKTEASKLEQMGGRTVFAGELADMSVVDLLQTFDLHKKTGRLELSTEFGRGTIEFYEGKVTHASLHSVVAEIALYRHLSATRGRFHFSMEPVAQSSKFDSSTSALLMEAMRRADEVRDLARSLPNLDHVVRLDEELLAAETTPLPRAMREFLEHLRDDRSLRSTWARCNVADAEIVEGLLDLVVKGILIDTGRTAAPEDQLAREEDSRADLMRETATRVEVEAAAPAKRPATAIKFIVGGLLMCAGAAAWFMDHRLAQTGPDTSIAVAGEGAETPAGELPPTPSDLTPALLPEPEPEPIPKCPEGMALVDGGKFFRGTQSRAKILRLSWPAHQVELGEFCIDAHEVTVAQYEACSNAGECERAHRDAWWPQGKRDRQDWQASRKSLSPLCNADKDDRGEHPINCVTWAQADHYCRQQNKRLPTETEWEYAARGSDGRIYPWGDELPSAAHLNGCGPECVARREASGLSKTKTMYDTADGFAETAPVGSFPAGKTQHGLSDMVGNVFEWTADRFAMYPEDASDTLVDPKGPEQSEGKQERRVIRGGAFNSFMAEFTDPALRFPMDQASHTHAIGFRCARDAAGDTRVAAADDEQPKSAGVATELDENPDLPASAHQAE